MATLARLATARQSLPPSPGQRPSRVPSPFRVPGLDLATLGSLHQKMGCPSGGSKPGAGGLGRLRRLGINRSPALLVVV